MESYNYPLAPFIKRSAASLAKAMLLMKDLRKLIDPDQYQELMLLLSTALRDMEEEILEPGGRPSVQQNHALAMYPLGSRYSRAQLADKLKSKKKSHPFQPAKEHPSQP